MFRPHSLPRAFLLSVTTDLNIEFSDRDIVSHDLNVGRARMTGLRLVGPYYVDRNCVYDIQWCKCVHMKRQTVFTTWCQVEIQIVTRWAYYLPRSYQ